MADRTVVLSQNGRHAVRGLSVNNPSEFSAYQDDDDDLTYVVDLSAYLDGATITVVTRVPQGVFISNSSNTTTRLTQRLRGFGYVDFKVQTSAGDVEEFRINILRRTGSKVVLGASGGGGTGVTPGDYGDISISAGNVWTIDPLAVTTAKIANQAVTFGKFQHIAQNEVVGRVAAGTGDTKALSANEVIDVVNAASNTVNFARLSGVQASDAELTAIAGLTSAADRLPYFTGSGTAALATFTAAGRALVDDADTTAQRATLGLGAIALRPDIVDADVNASAAIAPTKLAFTQAGTGAVVSTIDAKLKQGRASTSDFSPSPPAATAADGWYNDYTNSDGSGRWKLKATVPNTVNMTGASAVQGVGINFDLTTSAATPNAGLAETNLIRGFSSVTSSAGANLQVHQILLLGEYSNNVSTATTANESACILGTSRALAPASGGGAQAMGIWGGDFHVEKVSGVATGAMVGLEVGVHTAVTQSTTGSSNRQNGVEIWSGNRSVVTSAVAAHNALDIFGAAGWNNFIRCRHTDNATEVFKLAKDGRVDVLSPLDNAIFTVSVNQDNKRALLQLSGRTSGGSTVNAAVEAATAGRAKIGTTTNHPTSLITNNTNHVTINASGLVGVGYDDPANFAYKLDVHHNDNPVARYYQSGVSKNTDIYINNVGAPGDWLVTRRSNGEAWFYTSGSDPIKYYTNATERLSIKATGGFTIADANDFEFSTTTGTKFGTGTTQKIGFFNKAPVVQPAAVANANTASPTAADCAAQLNALLGRLRDLGLIAT